MNSGIYALYWWEQDLVYVGLSQNIDNRRKEHFTSMRNNRHTNYKVQNTFNQYGEPEFIILEYCSISELLEKEVQWCTEFDALGSHGLCLVEPGIVGFGSNSNASKYSRFQILKVFQLLYKGKHSMPEISKRTQVNRYQIFQISKGYQHIWLDQYYPRQYALMLALDRHKISNNTSNRALIKDKNNVQYVVGNVSEFCLKYFGQKSDKKHLSQVLTGRRKSPKGLTLVKLL